MGRDDSLSHSQVPPPTVSILSQINPLHFTHPTSWKSILILNSNLRLHFPSGLFPPGFPTKTLYTTLLSPLRATCSIYFILVDLIIRIVFGVEYRSLSSSLCSCLHSPVSSSLLGPNILLSTLFSNTLNMRSSLSVSDRVSHPYRTTGKIIVLCILIFVFLDRKLEEKRNCTEWQQSLTLLLISSWIEFWFVKVVPKYYLVYQED